MQTMATCPSGESLTTTGCYTNISTCPIQMNHSKLVITQDSNNRRDSSNCVNKSSVPNVASCISPMIVNVLDSKSVPINSCVTLFTCPPKYTSNTENANGNFSYGNNCIKIENDTSLPNSTSPICPDGTTLKAINNNSSVCI
jgi:hypothetical protein